MTLPPAQEARRLWLCADDYGIAPGVNAAIRDLIGRGRLNATSVMTVGGHLDPAAVGALAALRHAGGGSDKVGARVAIGLHVTLTGLFAPLTPGFVPRRHAAAHPRCYAPLGRVLGLSLARRLEPKALFAEVDAQFAAFAEAFGHPPDFVDGHQHVHLFPQVRDAVLDATKRRAPAAWVRQCGAARPAAAQLGDPKGLLISMLSGSFRRRAAACGLATNPAFAGNLCVRLRPRFFRAVSALSRRPAGRRPGDVPSRHRGRGARRGRPGDELSRTRIRLSGGTGMSAGAGGRRLPTLLACVAFSSREPVPTPDQVRGRLSLETL